MLLFPEPGSQRPSPLSAEAAIPGPVKGVLTDLMDKPMPETLTGEHRRAAGRRRRIVVNFDVTFAINVFHRRNGGAVDLPRLVDHLFEFADAADSQIDAVWWNWGEGNQAPYPSGRLPLYDHPLYRGWAEEGTDIVGILLEETRRRGLEAFFSHRMNGSDNDLGPFAVIPAKVARPEWTFRTPWCTHEHNRYWDFSHPEVREYVLENLREAAERWPFDGFELDFARSGVCFPGGTAWLRRDCMTGFVRSVREMLLRTGQARGPADAAGGAGPGEPRRLPLRRPRRRDLGAGGAGRPAGSRGALARGRPRRLQADLRGHAGPALPEHRRPPRLGRVPEPRDRAVSRARGHLEAGRRRRPAHLQLQLRGRRPVRRPGLAAATCRRTGSWAARIRSGERTSCSSSSAAAAATAPR